MNHRLTAFALLVVLCIVNAAAFAQSGPTFPPLTGQVVDQANILDAAAEQA